MRAFGDIFQAVDFLVSGKASRGQALAVLESEIDEFISIGPDRPMRVGPSPFRDLLAGLASSHLSKASAAVDCLLAHGIDIDGYFVHSLNGIQTTKTLLHSAIQHGTPEFVGMLLAHGCDGMKLRTTCVVRPLDDIASKFDLAAATTDVLAATGVRHGTSDVLLQHEISKIRAGIRSYCSASGRIVADGDGTYSVVFDGEALSVSQLFGQAVHQDVAAEMRGVFKSHRVRSNVEGLLAKC